MKLTVNEGNVTYLLDTGSAVVENTISADNANALVSELTGEPKDSSTHKGYNTEIKDKNGMTYYFNRVKNLGGRGKKNTTEGEK